VVFNPQQEKIVNQLSVMSAGRKQPRLLKLCNEDYIKHRTVMKAWSLIRKNKKEQKNEILRKQYESMEEASEELQKLSPQLYEIANQHQYGKRFPLELRVPTEYPPRQIWFYDYFPKAGNAKQ
jgi:large subunit ribosomal protein L40